jgi:hypothetical protein
METDKVVEKLKALYGDDSKHSRYQNIPSYISNTIGYRENVDENWRGDTARYNHLLHLIDFNKISSIGDIGANTGFFSLSLKEKFPALKIYAYEGNSNHTEFIETIKEIFGIQNLDIINDVLTLDKIKGLNFHDVLLFYNVMHHAGVDFDDGSTSNTSFKKYAIKYLKELSYKSKYIVFQMGYNWGGNKQKPIIDLDDDLGKILFNCEILHTAFWQPLEISLPHISANKIVNFNIADNIKFDIIDNWQSPSDKTIDYISSLELSQFSEFYRRPIFFCKSTHY